MIEQIAERARVFKVVCLGAIGSTTTGAWLVASMKAATVFFQCVAAFAAAVAGCLTVYYMVKSHRRRDRRPRIGPKIFIFFALGLILFATACDTVRPQKGGRMKIGDAPRFMGAPTVIAEQPENPAGAASTAQTVTEEKKMILPAKTEVVERRVEPATNISPATTNETRYILPTSTPVETKIVRESTATVGGAQKDEARTLGVKQAAMRPVMIAGIALLIGAGALAYFGNYLAAGIAGLIGVTMIVLFITLPQYGLYIMLSGLVLAALAILGVFYAYQKGHFHGIETILNKPTITKP